ncbi:MAG: ABC transporter ATP-binding protein [Planctomycetota bacterium]
MIDLNHVTKMYRRVVGVNDVCVRLKSAAYGLIGPNGSGKTTLINLLIGNLHPTLGSVCVLGADPTRDRRVLRRIGLCPASDVLYPNVSAREWVRYQVRLHGIGRRQADSMADAALDVVGMTDSMNRPMGTYSLGMRQRTKIAQAIAHQPDLLILDEPYNGLDPVGRNEMTRVLNDWTREGRGLIFASHVLQEIEAVTSSFLLIHGGRLLASGTAAEIESILAETPQQVRITGPDAPRLIPHFADAEWVTSLNLASSRSELTLTVTDAGELYSRLARWIHDDGLAIHRLHSSDGDLDAIFGSLLRHHRGEI